MHAHTHARTHAHTHARTHTHTHTHTHTRMHKHTHAPTHTGLCQSCCPPSPHPGSHDSGNHPPEHHHKQHHHKMRPRLSNWDRSGPQHGNEFNHWGCSANHRRLHVLLVWLSEFWLTWFPPQWSYGSLHDHIWRYPTLVQRNNGRYKSFIIFHFTWYFVITVFLFHN